MLDPCRIAPGFQRVLRISGPLGETGCIGLLLNQLAPPKLSPYPTLLLKKKSKKSIVLFCQLLRGGC